MSPEQMTDFMAYVAPGLMGAEPAADAVSPDELLEALTLAHELGLESTRNIMRVAGVGWIDTDTGELVADEAKPEFRVTDEASADWVLSKILDCDTQAEALAASLNAVANRMRKRLKTIETRRTYLLHRYGPQLREWAAANTTAGKKSAEVPHGRIQFRTTRPRVEVIDTEAATAWCRERAPHTVSLLPERWVIAKVELNKLAGADLPESMRVVPPTSRCTVETGIQSHALDINPDQETS